MILNLATDEKVILELRRHWFIFFLETVFLVIFLCLPFVALILLDKSGQMVADPVLRTWFDFGAAAWFLAIWVTFFIFWTNFYLDVWIITNKRVIDIEQYALFRREITEFRLENLQDITIEVTGFIPTMLNYGDILAETAGERKNCTIKDAPNPEEVKNLISALQADLSSKK